MSLLQPRSYSAVIWVHRSNNLSHRAMDELEKMISLFVKNNSISGFDDDDLAQELRIHLWNRLPSYDPTKSGLRTWSKHLLDRKIIDLYRFSQRKKRVTLNNAVSLSEGDSVYLGDETKLREK
jgi:DNA-directed RNA polymerase specialized sigma24 family protein